MKNDTNDLIMKNAVFGWIALGTALILMIPPVAMQFTTEVNWELGDFIVMGILIFGMSTLFVAVARSVEKRHRLLAGIVVLFLFLWIWAELAVGVFTNIGS